MPWLWLFTAVLILTPEPPPQFQPPHWLRASQVRFPVERLKVAHVIRPPVCHRPDVVNFPSVQMVPVAILSPVHHDSCNIETY